MLRHLTEGSATVRGPIPDWRDPSIGSMIRSAAWLADQVGVGGVFTKQQLRDAIPATEQVDRRMRDLRKYGWRIDEKRDDDTLAPNELRLVRIGLAVWLPEERAKAGVAQVSDRVRQAVFKRDGHACVRCGAAAGEYFDDRSGIRVRLTLAHKYPDKLRPSAKQSDFVTACQRCNESLRQHTDVYRDGNQVLEAIRELPRREQQELEDWMTTDTRPRSRVDMIWTEYRQLGADDREMIHSWLREKLQ